MENIEKKSRSTVADGVGAENEEVVRRYKTHSFLEREKEETRFNDRYYPITSQ